MQVQNINQCVQTDNLFLALARYAADEACGYDRLRTIVRATDGITWWGHNPVPNVSMNKLFLGVFNETPENPARSRAYLAVIEGVIYNIGGRELARSYRPAYGGGFDQCQWAVVFHAEVPEESVLRSELSFHRRILTPGETYRPRLSYQYGFHISRSTVQFNPFLQSPLSIYDGLAQMVAVDAVGRAPAADDPNTLGHCFFAKREQALFEQNYTRLNDWSELVIAWADEPPLLCPRAAIAIGKFRLSLEQRGYQIVGSAANFHRNLGEPGRHGSQWAMVIKGASMEQVQQLLDQAWLSATSEVRPHCCQWCKETPPWGASASVSSQHEFELPI